MALQHIQLRLKKRLEDEEKKKKGAGKQYFGSMKKPAAPKAPVSALGRRLATQGPRPYAGPVSGTPERKQVIAGSRPGVIPSHFKAPSVPTPTGGAPDYQQKAWNLRDKMVADRQAAADAGADEIYKRILMLDEEGQKIVLDATRASHPEYVESMEEKGYISPEGVIAKPKEDLEPVGEPFIGFDREMKVLMSDGSIKGLGEWVPEIEAKTETETTLTPSEQLAMARLNFDVEKTGTANVMKAIKDAGGVIVEGDMIKRPGENNYKKATQEDVLRRYEKIKALADYIRVETEGINSMEDIKIKYQHDPEAIKTAQRGAGLTADGVWSDAFGQTMYELFFKEE